MAPAGRSSERGAMHRDASASTLFPCGESLGRVGSSSSRSASDDEDLFPDMSPLWEQFRVRQSKPVLLRTSPWCQSYVLNLFVGTAPSLSPRLGRPPLEALRSQDALRVSSYDSSSFGNAKGACLHRPQGQARPTV